MLDNRMVKIYVIMSLSLKLPELLADCVTADANMVIRVLFVFPNVSGESRAYAVLITQRDVLLIHLNLHI